jgi:uncharacterized protein (TIGR03435 family)
MDEEYFDVLAKVPARATPDDVRLMLQHLLAERFKLTMHHESRETPGYALTIGKTGSRMKASPALPADGPSQLGISKLPGLGMDKDGFVVLPPGYANMITLPSKNGISRLTGARESIGVLCGYLRMRLLQPVVDQTGLLGIYDFHLAFASESVASARIEPSSEAPEPAPTLIQAVEIQLGLKLEPKRLPVDFLVIHHVEKAPIEN